MSYAFEIEYPEMDAQKAQKIKDLLQRDDILGDFGPGIGWWAKMLGKKPPKMSYATFINDAWTNENWDGEGDIIPLTDQGRTELTRIIDMIYNEVGGPLMLVGHWLGKKPRMQRDVNVRKFHQMLIDEGLPNNMMVIIDRRLEDRD